MKNTVKIAQSIVGTAKGRPEDEFYPTPPEATHALFKNMKFHDDRIWECACGDGVMAEIIQKYNIVK